MKKLITIILALGICFAFYSCKKEEKEQNFVPSQNLPLDEFEEEQESQEEKDIGFTLTMEHFNLLFDAIAKDKSEMCLYIVNGMEKNEFFNDEKLFDGKFDTDDLAFLFWKYDIKDADEFIKKYSSDKNPVTDELLDACKKEIMKIYNDPNYEVEKENEEK